MSVENPNQPAGYAAPGSPPPYDPVTGVPPAGAYTGSGPFPPPYPGARPVYPPGSPNPALAAILGFIPGVGAMYNGQFAKGIVHIAVFAVFSSLSEHANGIFVLLVAGWVFYMVFEAYQTARARRNGWPLPDPFGLNNVGERFGFRSNPDFSSFWAAPPAGGTPPVSEAAHVDPVAGGVHYARAAATGEQTAYHVDPAGNVHASTRPPEVTGARSYPPPPQSYGYQPYGVPAAAPFTGTGAGGPAYSVPPSPPYAVPPAPPFAVQPLRGNGLPTGALWLIGLGFLALLGSLRPFRFLQGEATGGLFLIAVSVLIFLRTGFRSASFAPGTAAARWNAVRSARGAGVVFIVGLLTLLQGLHIIYWSSSWPLLLIFFGVLLLIERLATNNLTAAAANAAAGYAGPSPTPAAAQPAASPTSIMPQGPSRPIANDLSQDVPEKGGR